MDGLSEQDVIVAIKLFGDLKDLEKFVIDKNVDSKKMVIL